MLLSKSNTCKQCLEESLILQHCLDYAHICRSKKPEEDPDMVDDNSGIFFVTIVVLIDLSVDALILKEPCSHWLRLETEK